MRRGHRHRRSFHRDPGRPGARPARPPLHGRCIQPGARVRRREGGSAIDSSERRSGQTECQASQRARARSMKFSVLRCQKKCDRLASGSRLVTIMNSSPPVRGARRFPMRVSRWAQALRLAVAGAFAVSCALLAQAGDVAHLKKEKLVGAWRLVSIDYRAPDGASVDPFYQPDSTGLIIYDASGWMSVHIAGPHRQAWKVPASRLPTTGTAQDSAFKVAA